MEAMSQTSPGSLPKVLINVVTWMRVNPCPKSINQNKKKDLACRDIIIIMMCSIVLPFSSTNQEPNESKGHLQTPYRNKSF